MITTSDLEAWVSAGWAIFPCHSVVDGKCSCGKPDCGSPGKHPITWNGVKGATRDAELITKWHGDYPNANWAVATGEPSGVMVFDLDVKDGKDGLSSWASFLNEASVQEPETFTVRSGSGGRHIYFRTGGEGIRNRVNLRPGVDVRGDGGYVLLPGSAHISGDVYQVEVASVMASCPVRLLDMLSSGGTGTQPSIIAGLSLDEFLEGIDEGARDDVLFKYACKLRRQLEDNRKAVTLLVLTAAANSNPPFPEQEALRKVDQAFKQDHRDQFDLSRMPFGDSGERPRLNLRTSGQLRETPDVAFLVEGVMPEGALFQMFGETGSYKSFIVLDLAMSIANGTPFMGHEVLAPGAVALILGEGGADAGQRIEAWVQAHPGSTDQLVVWSVEEQLDLMSADDIEAITEDLEEYRAEHFADAPWRLIVFDTQADHMPNGDEDRAKDFTVVKRAIQRIAHSTGAAVGLVHHTGWDKSRERGSSRQRQALDVVMQVDSMKITNVKQKFAAKFDQITFKTVPSGGSIYVEWVEPVSVAAAKWAEERGVGRDIVLALIKDPHLSTNRLKEELGIGHDKLAPARDAMEQLGYVELRRNAKGQVTGIEVTDAGRQWAIGDAA